MKKNPFLYRFMRPFIYVFFRLWYNPKIENKEFIAKEGRMVIAGNHKHALDPILVDCCTNRTIHTLAKKDLHDGLFGWYFRGVGSIPVDFKAKSNKNALYKAIDYLNNDCLINVSPEGKRNYTDEILLPFKPGAVIMAQKSNALIVPYSITGDYKFRSKNLKIVFGKPIDVSSMSVENANVFLYKKIKELLIENK